MQSSRPFFFSKGRGHRGQVQVVLVKDGSHRSPQKKSNIFPRLQPQLYVYPRRHRLSSILFLLLLLAALTLKSFELRVNMKILSAYYPST